MQKGGRAGLVALGSATARATAFLDFCALCVLRASVIQFVLATGLGHVVVTEPAHYAVLLRHVEEYHRSLEAQGRRVSLVEAGHDWCQSVYELIVARLKAGRARLRPPDRTLADLYVRLCEHKWLVSERARRDIGLEAALQDFERWAV
jgi:uncharacterized protein DUF4032